jgi:hypothetical protein
MRVSILLVLLAVATGCSDSNETVPSPEQTPATSNRPASAGGPGAPKPADANRASRVTPTEEQVAALQAAYDKAPSNDAAKMALVAALVSRGDYFMYSDELAPREKYPKALALYRRAAKLDPENATARTGIEQIESIYKSMNRPVPDV